jgi:hypothetical protein
VERTWRCGIPARIQHVTELLLSMVRCRWLSGKQCRSSGPLLLREFAFRGSFLFTVGNLPELLTASQG